jgi:FkbM family methyltransferase
MFKTRKSKRMVRNFTYLMPRSKTLHRIAKMYVDNYNGVNNSDMWSNGETQFLSLTLKTLQSPVVVDVGANVGYWCLHVLEINPQAHVFCIEPSSSTYQRLLEKTQGKPVQSFHMGMGDAPGELTFNIYGERSEINSFYNLSSTTPIRTETVTIETIDRFCATQQIAFIDFLKIDTEGFDFAVIRGAESMLRDGKIQYVQFEYGGNYIEARVFLRDVFAFIATLPYDLYRVMPRRKPLLIERYSPALDNFEHANYVLIKRS